MAWLTNADGSKHCTTCGDDFRPPRSCACPHRSTATPGDIRLGDMEQMTERAKALGMLDRLGLEQHLADRIVKADKQADAYRRHMRRVLKRGLVKMGPDGPMEADADGAAVKWAGLAEQASGRGDKLARALHVIVADREGRADMERQERLAEALRTGALPPPAIVTRGSA